MYGVCKICGCTEKDPCFHPDWGMCWWVNTTHDLCSHCADPDIANDPETTHRVNSTGMSGDCSDLSEEPVPGLYVEETVCPYPEREVCEGCPRYIEDEGICDMEY